MSGFILSVLDQSSVASGRSPGAAVQETLALARHVEALGFNRYWCAEHHNSASHAGSAPEVLLAAIGATTSRIRIGSAGVMLPQYSALKVAEQFRMLEAIAPSTQMRRGQRNASPIKSWKFLAGMAMACRKATPSPASSPSP